MAPETTNTTAAAANDVIHSLIFGAAVDAAETAIISDVPFLGLPIIKQLMGGIIQLIAGFIYKYLALSVTFTIIDAQTSAEAYAANTAATGLKTAISGGDQDAINQATDQFKDAFGKLVHLDGSAPPNS